MTLSAVTTKRIATVEQSPRLPAPAAVVRLPQRARQLDRLQAMAREAVAIVVPPIIVLSLLLLIWQIAAAGPKATLPTPLKIWQDAKDLIIDPWFVLGPQDIGLGWRVLTSLQRVAVGFGLSAIVGVALGALVGQSQWAMRGLDPIFQVLRTVPPLAWLPISLAAFRDSAPSAIFVIFITAIWPVINSPVFTETSWLTKAWQFAGTVCIRLFLFVPPILAMTLGRRGARWWPIRLIGIALVANVALLAPLDAGYSWSSLGREPDQAMARFSASSQFRPGLTYRLLRTSDGKVGMYQLIRAGGRLVSEFFPESIWGGMLASERDYSDFLLERRVDEVLVFHQLPGHVHTNEPQLLARMAASGRGCSKDTAGIRLVYSDDHWDYYAIDHSCLLTSAAREHHSGAVG
jgi:hypothetical protein